MITKVVKLEDITLNITDGTHSTIKDDANGDCYLLSCKNIKNGKINIIVDGDLFKAELLIPKA